MRVASLAGLCLLIVGPLACGGATATLGSSADGGSESAVPVPGVPACTSAPHRPQHTLCPSHSAGGVACSDDTQCGSDTPGDAPNRCLDGQCGPDQCVSDGDCGSGGVCSCAGETYGGMKEAAGNVCIPAGCQIDADCAPGYTCAPSDSCGSSYGVQGYYCHAPGDACQNDCDCGGDGTAGTPYCSYDEEVGQWACGSAVCSG
jgi:hypothetical protein